MKIVAYQGAYRGTESESRDLQGSERFFSSMIKSKHPQQLHPW
jgi:hypothetical protein